MVARTRRARSRILLLALVLVASVAVPVGAHDAADGVQADHAFAADPLYAMASGAGLYSRNADQVTAMASTTKVMSLIVALEAVDNGVVDLNDNVTISQAAATTGGSSMTADNNVPLQWLEVVSFEDLLFGMMIPSGNNATVAIAEHVAEGYLGPFGTVATFVNEMNDKADDLGLSLTNYQNPSGFQHSFHFTTARDLVRLWNAGMADSEFRRIVRPQTWVATGQFGNATKTYTLTKAGNYPGIEGHKNGINTNCSADQEECFVGSARRIGRRVIVAGMQADGWVGGPTGDAAEVFDHAFRTLFHPDPRGASNVGPSASRFNLVCPTTNRVVSASIPTTGVTRVTSWNTNVGTQTHTNAGGTDAPAGSLASSSGQTREIDSIALSATRVVTATNVAEAVELRLWIVTANGAPTTIGSRITTRTAGSARSIELVRLSSTIFATIARSTTNQLVVKTWKIVTTNLVPSITLLKSFTASAPATGVLEVDAASAPGQTPLRFVSVIRRSSASSMLHSWQVDATSGAISILDVDFLPETGTLYSIVPAPVETLADDLFVDKFYAIGYRRNNGGMGIIYTRVFLTGLMGSLSQIATAGDITGVELAPFGSSGLMSLARLNDGTLKPIVWESFRNPNTSQNPSGAVMALRISDHATTTSGSEPELCTTPTTKAEGDFVSGLREGLLSIVRLRGWRVGDHP